MRTPIADSLLAMTPDALAARTRETSGQAALARFAEYVRTGILSESQLRDMCTARDQLTARFHEIPARYVGMVGCTVEGRLVLRPGEHQGHAMFSALDAVNPPGRIGWFEFVDNWKPADGPRPTWSPYGWTPAIGEPGGIAGPPGPGATSQRDAPSSR